MFGLLFVNHSKSLNDCNKTELEIGNYFRLGETNMISIQNKYIDKTFKEAKKISKILYLWVPLFALLQFRPGVLAEFKNYYPGTYLSLINTIWQGFQIISTVLLVLLSYKRFKLNKLHIIYLVSLSGLLLSSISNNNSLSRFLSLTLPSISIVISFSIIESREMFNKFIKYFYIYFLVLIWLNFILVLLFPNALFLDGRGMSVIYLFGNYQGNFNWFVIFIILSYYSINECFSPNVILNRINYSTYVIMLITSLLVGSMTAIMSLGVTYSLIILMLKRPQYRKWLSLKSGFFFGSIVTIFIGVFDGLKYFKFLVVDIMGKNLTMGNRMKFWKKAFNEIIQKPIFGLGYETSSETINKIGKTTTHNHFINLFYNGGIVLFASTIALLILVDGLIRRNKYNIYSVFITASMFGYCVYFITESRLNNITFMFIISFAYYLFEFSKTEKTNL